MPLLVFGAMLVSTHSRPKAAASIIAIKRSYYHSFNTQPPEGGCKGLDVFFATTQMFQHTAARRRLPQTVVLSQKVQ